MIFTRRFINVAFAGTSPVLGTNFDFGLSGLRVSATIQYAGGMNEFPKANLLIYGLTKTHLNELSTLGFLPLEYGGYEITVEAGDAVNGMSMVFKGNVTNAWADMQTAPGVVMHVTAQGDMINQVKPSGEQDSAVSFDGAVPAIKILEKLGGLGGLKVVNHGLDVSIRDHYSFGSIMEQIRHVMDTARAEGYIDRNELHVWPRGQSRGGGFVVSKETGMVGIPGFTEGGVIVKKEFTRALDIGTDFTVQSEVVTVANRTWVLQRMDYQLESSVPHGDWFVILYGTELGAGRVQ